MDPPRQQSASTTTFQEYVDARYNLHTLCSSDVILFMSRISKDKAFLDQIVKEYEKWREEQQQRESAKNTLPNDTTMDS